jgi:hypothetical protein
LEMNSMPPRQAVTRYKCRRRTRTLAVGDAKGTMVNGTFLLRLR